MFYALLHFNNIYTCQYKHYATVMKLKKNTNFFFYLATILEIMIVSKKIAKNILYDLLT